MSCSNSASIRSGKNLHFSFGNLLNHLGTQNIGLWGLEESKFKDDIEEISDMLEKNVLPLFNEISSPESLISFINGNRIGIIKCTPFIRNLYLGFSYLYTKRYDLASESLIKALNITSDFIGDYKKRNVDLIEPLLNKINNKEFNSINDDLNSYIDFTRKSCNLI